LVIGWRHLQENCWFDLHSKWACLHHQHEMQQECCIYIQDNRVPLAKLYDTDHEARLSFVNWFFYEVYDK
jgi:hypothetical protein